MGLIGCPETSVMNYHYSPRSNPEERCSYVPRDGSLKLSLILYHISTGAAAQMLLFSLYSDTSANEDNSFRNHIR